MFIITSQGTKEVILMYADGYAAAMNAVRDVISRFREKLNDAESIRIIDQMDQELRQMQKSACEHRLMKGSDECQPR